MSIPLLWQVYNGQGNTAYSTRKALLSCSDKWIERKPHQQVWWVADREYTGKDCFRELLERKMQFCIGLRKNVTLTHHNKKIRLHGLFECPTLRTLPNRVSSMAPISAWPARNYPMATTSSSAVPPGQGAWPRFISTDGWRTTSFSWDTHRNPVCCFQVKRLQPGKLPGKPGQKGSKRSFSSCLLLPRMGLNNRAVAA